MQPTKQPITPNVKAFGSELFNQNSLADKSYFFRKKYRNSILPNCLTEFDCRLGQELEKTEKFFSDNKVGLITPDPFADLFVPISEYVRLNLDTQAHGYLNLYSLTGKNYYLDEARDRLDYIINLGPPAFRGSPFDGMLGWTFLYAYELTGQSAYFDFGIQIADTTCFREALGLNQGLMCGMALSKAYKITGNPSYANFAKLSARATAPAQHASGGFPHGFGEPQDDVGYSAWINYELSQMRLDYPANPDTDAILVKLSRFISQRVAPDGAIIGNAGLTDSFSDRGWTNDVPAMAYGLRAIGQDEKAQRALWFLFSLQTEPGAYPDNWGAHLGGAAGFGNTSVTRTSLIFMYLTSIPFIKTDGCQNGIISKCLTTTNNCSAAFTEVGACETGILGTNMCINGRPTGCYNDNVVSYLSDQICSASFPHCYSPDLCYDECYYVGKKKCVEGSYCSACYDTNIQCVIPPCEVEPGEYC